MTTLLVACESAPKPADPPLRLQAYEAEQEGAQRYERGEMAGAVESFAQAERMFAAIDDRDSVARLRRHRAQIALGAGQADSALKLLVEAAADDLAALALRAQAQLDLKQIAAAQSTLAGAQAICNGICSSAPSLNLLIGRAALARGEIGQATALFSNALEQLRRQSSSPESARELANALRLLAEARLAAGAAQSALPLAEEALALDRKLALPEKIARDWLLIGRLQQKLGAGKAAAQEAFLAAKRVASAANLKDLLIAADHALKESTP